MKKIIITPGEPAGIGPDITVQIAQHAFAAELIIVADPELLKERAKKLSLPLELILFDEKNSLAHKKNTLKIIPIKLKEKCEPGKLNVANASYVTHCLETAADFCKQHADAALVTGPVHKGILNDAGIPFQGHTEFLAQFFKIKKSVMLFVLDQLKVALATTHVPLKKVSETITTESLIEIIMILNEGLKKLFNITYPKISVCGLNPHAGENSYLGDEEKNKITPAIIHCREKGIHISGPHAADTAFIPAQLESIDAVLAMYHDQALPLIKHLGFDRAVNVTLGLPIVRTSVDHGTALSLAGTHDASCESLLNAIHLAITLLK